MAADHKQYRKLNLRKLGAALIYDGRGIIERSGILGPSIRGDGQGEVVNRPFKRKKMDK